MTESNVGLWRIQTYFNDFIFASNLWTIPIWKPKFLYILSFNSILYYLIEPQEITPRRWAPKEGVLKGRQVLKSPQHPPTFHPHPALEVLPHHHRLHQVQALQIRLTAMLNLGKGPFIPWLRKHLSGEEGLYYVDFCLFSVLLKTCFNVNVGGKGVPKSSIVIMNCRK